MGGSAAGGDFLSALCNLQGQIPVIVGALCSSIMVESTMACALDFT